MTLEPDRRGHPSLGNHGYPLARAQAPKLARSGGALHLQASSQFTDTAAAAGLRALERRVEAVPVAVFEFLQAGGVPAAVTIITSEPVHEELRDAAVSLLIAVSRRQPQAMSLAFMEARGMEAVAHLLGRGVQLRAGTLTQQGAATVAAAAQLLEAVLEAGGQPAARAFAEAGGFAALRMGLSCAQLGGQHGLEVAEGALGQLHRLVGAGHNSMHAGHAALCGAACAARTHQPVLALVYAHPHIPAAAKGMEVLRALAAASTACMRALLQSNCVDTCLTVLDRSDSNSKTAHTTALLLREALGQDPVCREDIVAKGGIGTFLNVLISVEAEGDVPIADIISDMLSDLAEGSADISHQEGKHALHWAAQYGEMQVLGTLLRDRPNLQAMDSRGRSALHLAVAAGQMNAAKLLLEAGADALARDLGGDRPLQLVAEGSPLWTLLIAELEWRACLEQPRPCHYTTPAGDASCSGLEDAWQGPATCSFLPLSGRVRIEAAGVPSIHCMKTAIKRDRSKPAQPLAQEQQPGQLLHEFKLLPQIDIAAPDDLTLSLDFTASASKHDARVNHSASTTDQAERDGCVGRLVIQVDSRSGERAPDLARALCMLLRRCHPGAVNCQAEEPSSGEVSRAAASDEQVSAAETCLTEEAATLSPGSALDQTLYSCGSSIAEQESFQHQQQLQHLSGAAPQPGGTPEPSIADFPAPHPGEDFGAMQRHSPGQPSLQVQQQQQPEEAIRPTGKQEGECAASSGGGEAAGGNAEPVAAESGQRQAGAESAAARRLPRSALEIARRLRRAPSSGAKSGAGADARFDAGADARSGAGTDAKSGTRTDAKFGAGIDAIFGGGTDVKPGLPAIEIASGDASSASAKMGSADGSETAELGSAEACSKNGAGSARSEHGDGAAEREAARSQQNPAWESRPEDPTTRSAKHGCQISASAAAMAPVEGKERSEGTSSHRGSMLQADERKLPKQLPQENPVCGVAAKAPPVMSYLPLAESRQRRARPKATPPPPPPPPLLKSFSPAAIVDVTATAAAVRAADDLRRQQQALGRGKLYAPSAQSVADKVRELELQIGLVQQLNSQGLRKEELPAAEPSFEHASNLSNAPVTPLPTGGPSRAAAGSGGPQAPQEVTRPAADSRDDKAVSQRGESAAEEANAAMSTSAEQAAALWEAVRRKQADKSVSSGPRCAAAVTVATTPAEVAAPNCEVAAPEREREESQAPQPPTPPQPPPKRKPRKPFAYGPRHAGLAASPSHSAAVALGDKLGIPATLSSSQDAGKGAACALQGSERAPAPRETGPGGARAPAGVIFVSDDSPSERQEPDGAQPGKPRRRPFAYGPRLAASSSGSLSMNSSAEGESSGGTSSKEIWAGVYERPSEDAAVLSQRAASVRNVFAYGPRPSAKDVPGPYGACDMASSGAGVQGWSAEPRFSRG